MTFDPGQTMVDVSDGAERLEKAADQLHDAIKRFEEAENVYEMEMAKGRLAAYYDAKDKPPAADLRNDMALRALIPEVRAEYAAAKSNKEALMIRFRALAAAVSARQSVLKALSGT